MATHPGPGPKRKDYGTKWGFDLALSAWNSAMNVYRYEKQRERDLAQIERQRQQARQRVQRQSGRQRREPQFPPHNGTVNGEPAYVQQIEYRSVGYHGTNNVGKIVSNDGVNAAFVRDEDGWVRVDEAQQEPYEPYYKPPQRY